MQDQVFDVAAEVQRYLATVGGAARANSDAYFEGGYWILLWTALSAVAVEFAFLHFGWAKRLSGRAERLTGGRTFLADLVFAAAFIALAMTMLLPWSAYADFIREHQYGLSTQGFGAWLGEWALTLALTAIIAAPIAAGLLKLVRAAPRSWWAWGAGGVTLVAIFMLVAAPVLISPLFNDYTPMPESALKEDIMSMARANGVPADNVYVVDQSRQTNRISANVQGLGPTIRISLNDNLLRRGTPAEVRAVMGHELGHYVLGHTLTLVLFSALLILVFFGLVAWIVPALIRRCGARWGIASLGDRTVLPLVMIVLELFFLAATPLTNSIVRTSEQTADIFGLNAAREPDGFASVAMKLSAYRKLDPGKWEEIIFFDHPSGRVRAETAMRWKAENLRE